MVLKQLKNSLLKYSIKTMIETQEDLAVEVAVVVAELRVVEAVEDLWAEEAVVHPEAAVVVEDTAEAGVAQEVVVAVNMVPNIRTMLQFLPTSAGWLLAKAARPSKQLILPLVLTVKLTKVRHKTLGNLFKLY